MEGLCRACLNIFNEPTELLQYCESTRRLFVYCTGVQAKRNDTFTFQLCKECYLNLKFSCKFKKLCRTSEKKFKSYLGLKKDGECIDFSTYLKNIEETLTFRLPITSQSNTPKKNYDDDDNESTCTSIQNFMSDMLQGEEMAPTEARIIREVIQEEADILDDSLDSHWLHDDLSIHNELIDLNFAGFSTPHSIDNDHCYTPRRLTNDREDDSYYYTPRDTKPKSDDTYVENDDKDMPLLDIAENSTINREYDISNVIEPLNQAIKASNKNDMPLIDDCDIELDGIVDNNITVNDLANGYTIEYDEEPNNEEKNIILNKGVAPEATKSPFTNELEYYMNNVEFNQMSSLKTGNNDENKWPNIKKTIDTVISQNKLRLATNKSTITHKFDHCKESVQINLNQGKDIQNIESSVKCELDEYINKAGLKKKLNIMAYQNKNCINYDEKCTIDRNMEIALKNDDSQEFSLDQLLISPQVSIRSGASTPTINSILFGNLTSKGSVVPDLSNNAVKKEPISTKSLEQYLKNDFQGVSSPKKEPRRYITVKDLNKLKESKIKTQRKIIKGDLKGRKNNKPNQETQNKRGYKDITKLKNLIKFENETSDSEMSDYEQSYQIKEPIDNKEDFEIEKENHSESVDNEMLKSEQSRQITEPIDNKEAIEFDKASQSLDSEMFDIVYSETIDNKEPINLLTNEDDLDISISNLLDFDDNQSVDLNLSIASDFLKDDKLDEDVDKGLKENLFKIPLSPPDNKYDFDKNLCKICDKTFKNNTALKIHFVKTHKQQIGVKIRKTVKKICPTCGKGFRDSSNFNRHRKHHEVPDCFKCQYCTLEFPTQGRFNLHMRSHASEITKDKEVSVNNEHDNVDKDKSEQCKEDGKRNKSHICTTCGKVFKTVSNFNVHVKRHTKNYTVICEICQKGFFRKYDLEVHIASHSKDHQFKCQYCPKQYRSRYMLVGHMYRHLGKEKFKCEVCDRKFITKQYLNQHYKSEMCIQKRKALDEGREDHEVSVTYRPYVHEPKKPKENITESPKALTKDEPIDADETITECLELSNEEAINEESFTATMEANKNTS